MYLKWIQKRGEYADDGVGVVVARFRVGEHKQGCPVGRIVGIGVQNALTNLDVGEANGAGVACGTLLAAYEIGLEEEAMPGRIERALVEHLLLARCRRRCRRSLQTRFVRRVPTPGTLEVAQSGRTAALALVAHAAHARVVRQLQVAFDPMMLPLGHFFVVIVVVIDASVNSVLRRYVATRCRHDFFALKLLVSSLGALPIGVQVTVRAADTRDNHVLAHVAVRRLREQVSPDPVVS